MARRTPKIVHAKRIGPTLMADRSRVLLRPFRPGTEDISRRIVARVLALPDLEVDRLLNLIVGEFENRHEHVGKLFRNRFAEVRQYVGERKLSASRQALIGAHFTHEYSPESAALFNPSIVPHPDQTELPGGALRFILSLRATGEGHISSITFRVGVVSAQHRVTLTPPVAFATEPERVPNVTYDKGLFARKLHELGLEDESCQRVLGQLEGTFTINQLRRLLTIGK
jgi:hypothetical protein